MNLFFYDVDIAYVKHLKDAETAKRGFTRIPDIEYENRRKMVCGVVLEVNEFKYYVPISSYKKKQNNNLLIKLKDDRFNQVKGSSDKRLVYASCDFKLLEDASKKYFPASQSIGIARK